MGGLLSRALSVQSTPKDRWRLARGESCFFQEEGENVPPRPRNLHLPEVLKIEPRSARDILQDRSRDRR
jgi:hypothetical protein